MMTERTCFECPAQIGAKNKSGRCRRCHLLFLHRDPMVRAKKGASLRRTLNANPEMKAERLAKMNAGVTPESRRRGASKSFPLMFTPEALAKREETWLGWCPPAYRPLFRELRHKLKDSATARQAVLAQVKADEAKLSPFERQERALMRGARLIANDQRPSLGAPADFGERRWG